MIKQLTYKIEPVEPGSWQLFTNSMALINGWSPDHPDYMQPVFSLPVSADLINLDLAQIGRLGFEARLSDTVIREYLIIWQLPLGYYHGARVRLQAQEVQL